MPASLPPITSKRILAPFLLPYRPDLSDLAQAVAGTSSLSR
jgi:hypothetical protein